MAYPFWWWGHDDSGSRQLVGIRRHFHRVSIVAPTAPEGMGHMADGMSGCVRWWSALLTEQLHPGRATIPHPLHSQRMGHPVV